MKFLPIVFCLMLFITQSLPAQDKLIDISGHADCQSMKKIQLRPLLGPFSAPAGYGDILEFSNNDKNDSLYMERENNTVWLISQLRPKNQCRRAYQWLFEREEVFR